MCAQKCIYNPPGNEVLYYYLDMDDFPIFYFSSSFNFIYAPESKSVAMTAKNTIYRDYVKFLKLMEFINFISFHLTVYWFIVGWALTWNNNIADRADSQSEWDSEYRNSNDCDLCLWPREKSSNFCSTSIQVKTIGNLRQNPY